MDFIISVHNMYSMILAPFLRGLRYVGQNSIFRPIDYFVGLAGALRLRVLD